MRESGIGHEDQPLPPASSPDERWALVARICSSPHLARSTRLKELLHYVCRRSWNEGAEEIREHELGVGVFQRPPQYDSTQDTIVRVQASQLRKRLERYFAEEGRDEQLILEVSRGSYLPVVYGRSGAQPELEATAEPAAGERRALRHYLVWLLASACVGLLLLCGWLFQQLRSQAPVPVATGPTVRQFWSAFAANGAESFIVVADSSYSALQDAIQRPIGIDEYVRRGYEDEFSKAGLPPRYGQLLRYLMARRYTSLADVLVVRRITESQLLNPSRTSVVHTRDHNIRAFQQGNHILIGSQRAIPWVSLFDSSLDFHLYDGSEDFHMQHDERDSHVWVENRRPRPGEPPRYVSLSRGAEGTHGYALIACLPNLSRTGNVLILAGTDMTSTEAAGTLLTTESFLAGLLNRLPAGKGSGLPHFEALLDTQRVESSNRGFEIVALHPH
ncbi:MAG: hypothetical protein IT164_03290 [Bryobacterales bacterium]|nr:hypothetical protein [Bryobacterales bacterium]